MIPKITALKLNRVPVYGKNNVVENKQNNPITYTNTTSYNYTSVYPIAFLGNFNPVANYDSEPNAVQLPGYLQLSNTIKNNILPNDYAKESLSKLFQLERNSYEAHYFGKVNDFNKFGKLGFLENFVLKDEDTSNYLNNHNKRKIANDYSNFFDNNIKSMEKVAKGEQDYTNLFLTKNIDNENLVDFWLKELNTDCSTNKIETLNEKLREEYNKKESIDDLAIITINKYFNAKISPQKIITSKDNTNSIDLVLEIKNKLNEISELDSTQQKMQFKNLINNDKLINATIENGTSISELLLSTIKNEGIYIKDLNQELKKEFLQEIANDNALRNESIDSALKTLRKQVIILKSKEAKNKSAADFVANQDLKNFDNEFVKKLFEQNSNERAIDIINDIKLFEKEAEKVFSQMIIHNPFTSKNKNEKINENLSIIFTLVNNRLESIDKEKEADIIWDKLSDLSDCLYEQKDMNEADKIWQEINKIALDEWKENHLPKIIKSQQENYLVVENFLKNSVTKDIENINIINTIFKSDIVTIEEKAFLSKKVSSPEGYDLYKFLSEHVPNNNIRKKIINNLIDNERLHSEIFNELFNYFIDDIRNKECNSSVINKIIQNKTMCDLFIQELPNNYSINEFSDIKQKLTFLNKHTDEELYIVAEKVKEKYMIQKSLEAFEDESAKYDMSQQIDSIMKNLVIETRGQKYNLFDVINLDFTRMEKLLTENNNITQNKLDETFKLLCANTRETKQLNIIMSAIFDRMEAANPANRQQVRNMRSIYEKIKAGVFNQSNIMPGAMVGSTIIALSKAGLSSGEPHAALGGAILYGIVGLVNIINNVYKQFKE